MQIDLIRSSHSIGEANYHLLFTAAYRRPVFADPLTRILTRDYILAATKKTRDNCSRYRFRDRPLPRVHCGMQESQRISGREAVKGLLKPNDAKTPQGTFRINALGKEVLDRRLLLQNGWRS